MPRVWAPDLVPYGPAQAILVSEAAARSGVSWWAAYADPSYPLFALADPVLRSLPAPVSGWIVPRGLLDALGVSVLYLAVARLIGRPAGLLAALLYALSPSAWATARDPAGTLTPLLVALGLFASVRLVTRPTPARGIMLGLVLAVLVRSAPPGWGFIVAGALTLAVARASRLTGSLTALALLVGAGPAAWTRPSGLTSSPDDVLSLAWQTLLGVWGLPAGSVPPGGVVLLDLLAPAAVLAVVLAALGTVAAMPRAWNGQPRLLVLPIWAGLALLWPAVVRDASFFLPALAALMVVPLAVWPLPFAGVPLVWARWAAGAAVGLSIGLGAVTVSLNVSNIEAAERDRASFDPSLYGREMASTPVVDLPGLAAWERPPAGRSLRAWQALATAVRQTAERVGTSEVVSVADADSVSPTPMLESLLRGRVAVRRLPPQTWVLPLERETLFLLMPGVPVPVELTRASSRLGVVTSSGTDTGARLATLRARPAVDWLARADPVQGGRFADGSTLVGVTVDRRVAGRLTLTLFWELPAADDGRTMGQTVRLTSAESGTPSRQAALLPVEARRGGELVAQAVAIPVSGSSQRDPVVSLTLLDAAGRPIPTSEGASEVRPLSR